MNFDSLAFMESNINNRIAAIKDISTEVKNLVTVSDQYKVLFLTDIHFGSKYDYEKSIKGLFEWLDGINSSERPAFCFVLGDVSDNGFSGEYSDYKEFVQKLDRDYSIKTMSLVGNHDVYHNGWENWKESCYPNTSFYKLSVGNKFVWYCLDTGSGELGENQYKSLKKSLEAESKIPIVMTHYPLSADEGVLYAMRNTTERNLLISLLSKSNVRDFFCGHYHPGSNKKIGNIRQHCLNSFGQYQKWYILNVDEDNGTVSLENFGI